MTRALLALLCGLTLVLLPISSADPIPEPGQDCYKVPCPYLHLIAVCGGLPPDDFPNVIIGNDTSDCR